ncbi:MAG: alpha-glucan family phosphorylase [Desulfocapsa sp.]|nr:alpha-glucan family phosphorylase [Desulfocapsa sp.]
MQASNFNDNSLDLHNLVAKNQFGTFFGVSQQTLDTVWDNLTGNNQNSVVYISMEIGADPDVFHPIKDRLMDLEKTNSMDSRLKQFVKKIFEGPEKIPCYGGGLGVLAGDTLKSFADCRLPVVAVSLLYRHGYFSQIVDSKIGQIAQSVAWTPEETPGLYLLQDPENPGQALQVEIPFFNEFDQETLAIAQVWMKMEVNHTLDYFIPELLLDFSLADNPVPIKNAAGQLYNSDSSIIKATQRRMLGTGILPVLQAMGISSYTLHLNEQHGVVVVLQLIAEELAIRVKKSDLSQVSNEEIIAAADKVADRLVYTIHTPVKAGHDRFNKSVYAGISHRSCRRILDLLAHDDESLHSYNFTTLAMRVNRTANSVSRLHRDVTHKQFPNFANKITAITNGVHHLTWISDARAELFDNFPELKNWRRDPGVLRNVDKLKSNTRFRTYLLRAWEEDTTILYKFINKMLLRHRNQMTSTWIDPPNHYSNIIDSSTKLDPKIFTVGFARRFSTYKRADLIFDNIGKLCSIAVNNNWPINFLFSGKAHPADEPGKSVIKLILNYQQELHAKSRGLVNLIFIPNYDMHIAKMMVAGVHIWLNNPKRPLEASGTSGMKAALNGVPNLSIMDGWWVEGYHEGQTGWKFGREGSVDEADLSESPDALLYAEDSASFYATLPLVLEEFYENDEKSRFIDKAIMNLILNVPIFNTHRMAAEYLQKYQLKLPSRLQSEMDGFSKLYNSNE